MIILKDHIASLDPAFAAAIAEVNSSLSLGPDMGQALDELEGSSDLNELTKAPAPA